MGLRLRRITGISSAGMVEQVNAPEASTKRRCHGEVTLSMDCGACLDPALRSHNTCRFA